MLKRWPILLKRPVVLRDRLGEWQRWRINHFPHRRNRRYALQEALRYSRIIDTLNCRFGLVSDEPQIQICREGAYVNLRHYVEEPLAANLEKMLTKKLEASQAASSKPTLDFKLKLLETDGPKMAALSGTIEEMTPEQLAAEEARLARDRRRVLEVLKRWSTQRRKPPFPVLDYIQRYQHFYDHPLVPYDQANRTAPDQDPTPPKQF
eukprot:RCo011715